MTVPISLATLGVLVFAVAFYFIVRGASQKTQTALQTTAGVVGVALASVSITIAVIDADKAPTADPSSSKQNVEGEKNQSNTGAESTINNGGCVQVEGDCVVGVPSPEQLSDTTDYDALLDDLSKVPGSNEDPKGAGPWPFIAFGTSGQGLYYRTGYGVDDRRLPGEPTLPDGRVAYADCQVKDKFAADPSSPNRGDAATWLKVRFPQPADKANVWLNGGYLVPIGHNGDVPIC